MTSAWISQQTWLLSLLNAFALYWCLLYLTMDKMSVFAFYLHILFLICFPRVSFCTACACGERMRISCVMQCARRTDFCVHITGVFLCLRVCYVRVQLCVTTFTCYVHATRCVNDDRCLRAQRCSRAIFACNHVCVR